MNAPLTCYSMSIRRDKLKYGMTRRTFVRSVAAASIAASSMPLYGAAESPYPRLRKAVKFDMIGINGTIREKLELVKSLGFKGVEINYPSDIDLKELVAAKEETGIVVHGVIDSIHWTTRLSDPNPDVRAKGLDALIKAIDACKTVGGTTVLLVPGAVKGAEESFDLVWQRSQEQVRKAIPHARDAGVKIAIEVVWNNFITKPEQLVKYVDEFQDKTVGAYFDVSNMVKYGVPPADWIRALGDRMLKFDFKGYSNTKKWVPIGEGDENWPEVRKALAEIKYDGWATSEVDAGGKEHLADVARRMNEVLGLS